MSDIMGGREVLDLAIEAEEKGARLYKTLAKNSKNFHVKEVFEQLARDEEEHLNDLKAWADKIVPYQPGEAYPGEYQLYIKAMAQESTFKCDTACQTFLETDINEKDAIQAGITFEKDFILFLHNLKNHVSKDDEPIVDKIVASEETHLKKLYTARNKLNEG